MKITTLSSAAIIAALTLGSMAPMAAFADATELESTGTVTVEEGGDEEGDIDTIDTENPSQTLPEIDYPGEVTNPDRGPLMIEKVSNLDFGTIKTSADTVKAWAAPVTLAGTTDDIRGSFVQWRDIRAGGTSGYTITAELTQQFTGVTPANKLNGATIDFTNGFVVAQADNTNTAPGTVNPAFQLSEQNGAREIVVASENQGKGRYSMAFGDSREDTAGESVQLTVPSGTASNMALDTYTAKVTWKVVAAPTPEA